MEPLKELNEWQEGCRLRMANIKKKCAILKAALSKRKDSFNSEVWQMLEQCNEEVRCQC